MTGLKNVVYYVNYIWRLFATAIGFSIFGIGALLLTFLVFPFVYLFFPNKIQKVLIRKVISYSFRAFMWMLHYLGIIRFNCTCIEKLKNNDGGIFIANHPSLIDVVAIIAYTPNAGCIVKKELWDNFFLKGVVKAAGYIPNINPDYLIEKSREAVANGDLLVIFPEGTRTVPGQPMRFKRGASHIILSGVTDVLCGEVQCNPVMLSKNIPWYRIPVRRPEFTLSIKGQLDLSKYVNTDSDRIKMSREITKILYNQYCPND